MNDSNLPESEPDYGAGGVTDSANPTVSAFRIQPLLAALWKYWWIPVLSVPLCLAAAALYAVRLPPTYISKAAMWETAKMQMPGAGLFSEDAQNFLATQTELLESSTVREATLARLRNAKPKPHIPRTKGGRIMPVKIRVVGAKSSVFIIEATCADADFARVYLDALMDVYLDYKKEERQKISGGTLESLQHQIERTEAELKNKQEILEGFQRSNNMAVLQQDGSVAGSYLANLKTKISDLELEDRLIRAGLAQQDLATNHATNSAGGAVDAGAFAGTPGQGPAPLEVMADSKELEMLKVQRAKLSRFLRPKHPKIVKIDEAIARNQRQIAMFQRQSREQLVASLENNQLKLENYQASIKEWEKKSVEANTRLAEAEKLKINVQREQGAFDRLTMMMENLRISRNLDQENLDVLDRAGPAARSYSRETGSLALGGIGGLGLGLGIVILIGLRDDRFASISEVKVHLGEVVMGQVPMVTGLKDDENLPLIEIDDPRHAYAESFRGLRSALYFMATQSDRPRVLLVTSAVPHEGKSTVAANLARTLALAGSRVVLVDADLRRGVLHKVMGLQAEPGLAELLRQPGSLDQIIQTNCLPNLAFIPRGKVSSNARDLFLGEALDQIVSRLRREYDFVVIDGSPVFASDDASTLAPQVDGTLFVVRSHFSSPKPVREALDQLHQRRARVLGVVFNQADASRKSYHQYKYAEYYAPANQEKKSLAATR